MKKTRLLVLTLFLSSFIIHNDISATNRESTQQVIIEDGANEQPKQKRQTSRLKTIAKKIYSVTNNLLTLYPAFAGIYQTIAIACQSDFGELIKCGEFKPNRLEAAREAIQKMGMDPEKIKVVKSRFTEGAEAYLGNIIAINERDYGCFFSDEEFKGVIAHECIHLKESHYIISGLGILTSTVGAYYLLKLYAKLIDKGISTLKQKFQPDSRIYKILHKFNLTNKIISQNFITRILVTLALFTSLKRYLERRADLISANTLNCAQTMCNSMKKMKQDFDEMEKYMKKNEYFQYLLSKISFKTHPSLEKRIKYLEALAVQQATN